MEEQGSQPPPQIPASQDLWQKAKKVILAKPVLSSVVGICIVIIVLAISIRSVMPTPRNVVQNQADSTPAGTIGAWPVLWGPPNPNCATTPVSLSAAPVALDDIVFIEPMGELKEGHIVPGDHIGINYDTTPRSQPINVYAPADGYIVNVERHPYTPPAGYPPALHHYHVYLEHSCNFFTGFVHLTEFDPAVISASPELQQLAGSDGKQFQTAIARVPVRAGQRIGTTWSFGLLGMVTVDRTVTNEGYLNLASYSSENWRPHAVAPFDYFTEPLKNELLAKNPRVAEPRGGKIDFDQAGKIVGNWFEDGTGGFRDDSVPPRQCGNFPCPYWEGHLALVYDYIDPAQLRVSIGHQTGLSDGTPYGVKGNAPDFKNSGVAEELVKYELVALKDISREKGYITDDPVIEVSDERRVLGVLVVQLLDPDTLKAEVFPGQTPAHVPGFTTRARVYQR